MNSRNLNAVLKTAASSMFLLALLTLNVTQAQAQTETVLHRFTGGADGAHPRAGLVLDALGNLYGTTDLGGAYGLGTVFQIAPAGKLRVLYAFQGGSDGQQPRSTLVRDAEGDLFGTTAFGGAFGEGTVFEITRTGKKKLLHAFMGGADGAEPGGMIRDGQGNLFGTTIGGTVFEIAANGTEKTVYLFQGIPDGAAPFGDLIEDGKGNFYGTTFYGGVYGNGTVFELDHNGQEKVIYSFQGFSNGRKDGVEPFGGVVRRNGKLFGTTWVGGPSDVGTVFEIAPDGTEKLLQTFQIGTGGSYPTASLIVDESGNLQGTTYFGGTNGFGTVFEITPDGVLTTLYNFQGNTDGAGPQSKLVRDKQGNLYGTTYAGGPTDNGTVYKLVLP